MEHYEAMFLFKSDLTKDEIDRLLNQIKDIIAKQNGSIDQIKEGTKQRLSYPIKKYKDGFYYLVNFHLDPEAISKIRRSFSLNESILRVLITRT